MMFSVPTRAIAIALCSAVCDMVLAEEPLKALDLPPLAAVERALAVYPPIVAARDAIRYESANGQRLRAGPYEFAVRGGYLSHSIPTGRSPEWDFSVERPLRLPSKARADTALGEQGVTLARRVSYNAWCDGARHLLKLWFAWARENVQLDLWQQQVESLRQQQAVVEKRTRARDAPRVELNLAQAALAQAEAVMESTRGREVGARYALERTFHALEIPKRALLGDPRPLQNNLDFFVERVRIHNDEVRVARAMTRRAKLFAQRAAADRVPDPALGVRLSSDRSAKDTIAGVYIIVPIPGAARRAFSDGAYAQSEQVFSQEAAVVQRVTADISMMYGQALGAYAAWERAREAAAGMKRNAESMVRSWQLREASLSDVLLARRLSVESALTSALNQIDAEETRYRVLIEAHLLWNDPQEEKEEHTE